MYILYYRDLFLPFKGSLVQDYCCHLPELKVLQSGQLGLVLSSESDYRVNQSMEKQAIMIK